MTTYQYRCRVVPNICLVSQNNQVSNNKRPIQEKNRVGYGPSALDGSSFVSNIFRVGFALGPIFSGRLYPT